MINVQQAREAAEHVRQVVLSWQEDDFDKLPDAAYKLAKLWQSNLKTITDFILDHFPEDGEEVVTKEWLIEEWRFERHKSGKLFSFEICGWWSTNSNKCMIWWYNPSSNGISITTRHQARQLFQALGIKKRGEA